jgi:flagellar operon protein
MNNFNVNMSLEKIYGLPQTQPQRPSKSNTAGETVKNFTHVLNTELNRLNGVRFSHHAMERMHSRDIQLTTNDVQRLKSGIERIASKGGRESLVCLDQNAFLVNAQKNMVITAMDATQMRQNIITNIDSAVFV